MIEVEGFQNYTGQGVPQERGRKEGRTEGRKEGRSKEKTGPSPEGEEKTSLSFLSLFISLFLDALVV